MRGVGRINKEELFLLKHTKSFLKSTKFHCDVLCCRYLRAWLCLPAHILSLCREKLLRPNNLWIRPWWLLNAIGNSSTLIKINVKQKLQIGYVCKTCQLWDVKFSKTLFLIPQICCFERKILTR